MKRCRWITLDELEGRRAEWHEFAANCVFPSAFADPGWILPWWRVYGNRHHPWFLILEDAKGSLQGLAPLVCRRTRMARTLTFAGGEWNGLETLLCTRDLEAEFSALLLEELDARRQDWDVWRIRRVPTESCLAQLLLEGCGPLKAAAHDIRLQPFLELPPDGAAFEARFGSKQRGTQRRKWRRLLELGARPRLVSDLAEIEPAVHRLLELRRARAMAMGQRYAHMDARFGSFLVDVMRESGPNGTRLWTLEVDKQTLVMRLDLVQGVREHSYLLGLSDGHTALSPGSSLERHAILEAIAEGRTELDLGPGRDEYKYRLGAIDRELTRLVALSPSIRGRIVGSAAALDLTLRNTSAADALRRRRGMVSERGASKAVRTPLREHANK